MRSIIIKTTYDIARLSKYLHEQPKEKPLLVEVKQYRKNRTVAQNKLYRRWLGEISKYTGDTPDGLHEHFKNEYIDTEYTQALGKTTPKTKTTTDLNTKEFSEYLGKIEHFSIHFLNCPLSHPEDLYMESMYGAKKGPMLPKIDSET